MRREPIQIRRAWRQLGRNGRVFTDVGMWPDRPRNLRNGGDLRGRRFLKKPAFESANRHTPPADPEGGTEFPFPAHRTTWTTLKFRVPFREIRR